MQKATYYDSSAIYSGYPYQSANGFSYDANQVQYPRASHVESEYHRPACSLQSPDGSVALQKPGEMAESCERTAAIQATQSKVHTESNQAHVAVSGPPPPSQSPGAISQNTSNGSNQPSAKNGSPTSTSRSKHIFPWMKESRQNTKQKPTSSSSSGTHKVNTAAADHTHTHTHNVIASVYKMTYILVRVDTLRRGCESVARREGANHNNSYCTVR